MPRAKSNVPPPETPRPTGGASRRRRRAQHSLGHLTSTDVTAELFFRGHRVNRNRLGEGADALWVNGEIRENPYTYRRFSPDQVEQVALALDLSDDLGFRWKRSLGSSKSPVLSTLACSTPSGSFELAWTPSKTRSAKWPSSKKAPGRNRR